MGEGTFGRDLTAVHYELHNIFCNCEVSQSESVEHEAEKSRRCGTISLLTLKYEVGIALIVSKKD